VQVDQIQDGSYKGPRAITTQNYKLILDQSGSSSIELYDLSSELGEQNNLAKARPEKVKELQKLMREWQTSVLASLQGKDYP